MCMHLDVVGRLFDHHILDMIELGVDNFQSMYDIEVTLHTRAVKVQCCVVMQSATWLLKYIYTFILFLYNIR